ncbi:YcnI family protein [Kitasatospora atroaurantiaca]|uniref:Uncharacterized protein YcnI n=1 Tax=Kitasatospora atroaurantiaca TaxID=285545 RepID=A0A561EKA2_9ACTN|nr:DUF1775 domain-containing protein [Kitasatospora atroaurantiaca]TWE16043.1 uncharacterized protein YcnI [Kitasatospora atroaurantiaca]
MNRSRILARVAAPLAALAGAVALAGPAFAHVEVESDTARALAVNAVVAFDAEGESATAGISQIRVALPAGIAPADVTLAEGPQGWSLTAASDGYTVAGPALAPGKSAEYKIKVRQLPDAKELAFKSLVTYTDGQVDRWIELPQGGSKPEHPAPVLKLTAAAPGAAPLAASPSASAGPSVPATTSTPTAQPAPLLAVHSDGGSSDRTPVLIGIVAAVLVAGGGVAWWRRRSARS